jgi:carbon storage regulator
MLVLSRKPGESIHIGSDIVITAIAIGGGRLRIGITCPREVPVRRSELSPLESNVPSRRANSSKSPAAA